MHWYAVLGLAAEAPAQARAVFCWSKLCWVVAARLAPANPRLKTTAIRIGFIAVLPYSTCLAGKHPELAIAPAYCDRGDTASAETAAA